ncbi:delta(1)-pyrroline-2-carboxylate reductase family protein [Variovorax sp. PCZ-1]|uniref:delta(1)-pyrroline-2-carboxylate reductase family protein n=1 Tax=Variovorax sp. PCZ-1 TaxID=2835533 RepID=UPI001BD0F7E2|nr:delta(1)-pyrroline-2-carboxylate reductase family protein [Variovorax sp. PCZ-1]MBS7808120.1 delta(1)-pyrroline-2-carboxylate reductase family protein [Variovorax sp. PCZ-1]
MILNASQTATLLPYAALAEEITRMLQEGSAQVPERIVQSLPGGASLFVMPATDGRIAITKLISFTPANAAQGRATIQGDVIVFDVKIGERIAILDGPTITARRTAAVSLLAAQRLAVNTQGPLLIVGAGVQGQAHLEAFAQGLGIQEVIIASRTPESSERLAAYARTLGLQASITQEPNAALAQCPLVVTCTPASGIVLSAQPRADAFIAAVGAFKPNMIELAPSLCQYIATEGQIVVDTKDAAHEAGDLIQAGLDIAQFPTLAQIVRSEAKAKRTGSVLFKSCGWAAWDLAAARLAVAAK